MIVNFGSLNIDYVYRQDHIVAPGETISSNGFSIHAGGKGLNQSVAIARASGEVVHAGAFGYDGLFLKSMLEDSGVDVSLLKEMDKCKNGHAIIQVDKQGENAIVLYEGTNGEIDRDYIDLVIKSLNGNETVLFQNEISEIAYAMKVAKEAGCSIVLNPAPMNEKVLGYPLELVDTFIVNLIEGQELFGSESTDEIIENCLRKYSHCKIILTLGSEGAIYAAKDERIFVPAEKVSEVVDTTAAGDTFIGYYLALKDKNLKDQDALKTAAKAATICVAKKGAAISIPKLADIR